MIFGCFYWVKCYLICFVLNFKSLFVIIIILEVYSMYCFMSYFWVGLWVVFCFFENGGEECKISKGISVIVRIVDCENKYWVFVNGYILVVVC